MKMLVPVGMLAVCVQVFAGASPASGQTADDEVVVAVVEELFDAMRARDSVRIRQTMLADARLLAPFERADTLALRVLTADQFARMAVATPQAYDERMHDVEVRIDDDIATVWGEYTFRVGERVTNCGSNAVQLVRTRPGWRISQFTSTIRTADCERRDASGHGTNVDAPSSPPLMSLMTAPTDGLEYYAARQRAEQLIAEQNHASALPLVERLVREYPRDGDNWRLLGQVRAGLDEHAAAGAAYERAAELLGWNDPLHLVGYHAIANHVEAGNDAHALSLLRAAIFEHRNFYLRSRAYGWNVFAGFREDPEFLAIVGRTGRPEQSRDERWRHDIDYLVEEVRRVNPDHRDAPFPEEFVRRYRALRAGVDTLSEEEIFVGMNRLLAVLRQGHLSVFPPAANRHLPMQFYAFPEGIYIVAADSPYASLAGRRVLGIGSTSIAEVLGRLADVRSTGSDMQHLWGVSDLSSAYHLKGTGLISSLEWAELVLESARGGRETVRVATTREPPSRRLDKLVPPPGVVPPRFLRAAEQSHWEESLPEYDALYVQLNQVRPDTDETLPAFGRRLASVLSVRQPKNLILDLRHNNGGDTYQYTEFLRSVVAFSTNPDARVYVLIGRRVFSAAANLVTDLERLANPVFVGEATSACCNFTGDPSVAVLPNSGISAELTAVRWNLSYNQFDVRRELQPDVPVQLTAGAYFAGEDPVLDAVLRMIRSSREGG